MEAVAWTAIALQAATFIGAIFYLGQRIDAVASRVDAVASRVDALSGRIDALSGRMDSMNARLDTHIEQRFAT